MKKESRTILKEAALEVGAPLSKTQLDDFERYLAELEKWNKKLNLTSIEDEFEIIVKHFIDSLTPLAHIGMGSFVMDVGSGAGFPGIPMKIARPDLRLMMMESKSKKVAFLNNVIRELKIKNTRAIAQRAESESFREIMGGQLNVVVARAFGDTESFFEVGAPYLKSKGKLIVMKGPRWKEQAHPKKYQHGDNKLIRREVVEFELPVIGDRRALLIYEKK